jgi:hypothetical protein
MAANHDCHFQRSALQIPLAWLLFFFSQPGQLRLQCFVSLLQSKHDHYKNDGGEYKNEFCHPLTPEVSR